MQSRDRGDPRERKRPAFLRNGVRTACRGNDVPLS